VLYIIFRENILLLAQNIVNIFKNIVPFIFCNITNVTYTQHSKQQMVLRKYCDVLSLLYNVYRVFPGGKVGPGRAADHLPPSSAVVIEEYSYTSIHPLGHTGPVTGSLYLFAF